MTPKYNIYSPITFNISVRIIREPKLLKCHPQDLRRFAGMNWIKVNWDWHINYFSRFSDPV